MRRLLHFPHTFSHHYIIVLRVTFWAKYILHEAVTLYLQVLVCKKRTGRKSSKTNCSRRHSMFPIMEKAQDKNCNNSLIALTLILCAMCQNNTSKIIQRKRSANLVDVHHTCGAPDTESVSESNSDSKSASSSSHTGNDKHI